MPTYTPVAEGYDPFAEVQAQSPTQRRKPTYTPVPEGFDPFEATPAPSEPQAPEWAGKYPNLYGLAGAAWEAGVKPTIELGATALGAAGGALAGTAAAPGVGTVLGALGGGGLGYATAQPAIREIESLLKTGGSEPPKTATEELKRMASDIPTGAAYAALGGAPLVKGFGVAAQEVKGIIPAAVQKVPGAMKRVGERLIGSELKVPPSLAADEVKAARDLIRRVSATPDEAGMQAVKTYADTTNRTVEGILRPGHNLGETIPRNKLIQALTEYKNEQMIPGNKDAVKLLIKEYQRQPKNIPLLDALKLKQQIYKDISDSAYKEAYTGAAALSNIQTQGMRGVANKIKMSLEELYPAIKPLTEAQKGMHIAEKSINRHIVESMSAPLAGGSLFSTTKKIIKPALSAIGIAPTKLGLRLTKAGEALGKPLGEKAVAPTAKELITEAEHVAAGRLPVRVAAEKEAARIIAEQNVMAQAGQLQSSASKAVLGRLAKEKAAAQVVKDNMASRIAASMEPDVKKALAEKEAMAKEILQKKGFNLSDPQTWSGVEKTPFQGGVNWRFMGKGRLEHTLRIKGV